MSDKGGNHATKTKPIYTSKVNLRSLSKEVMSKYPFQWEGSRGYLWIYDNEEGIWRPNGEDFITHYFRRISTSIADDLQKKHVISEIVADVQGYEYSKDGLPDPKITLIPFANVVYDLESDTIRDFHPDDCFTWKLPWKFNPDAKCEYLSGLIDALVPEEDTITLWELMAYSLWRKYSFHKFFMLHGGGSNGKSTFMNIFTKMLGYENISSISLEDIQRNNFAGAYLYKKLANIAGEIEYGELKSTKLIKKMTGEDSISSDRKYKERISFFNYAKVIFLTNRIPKTSDTTEAFYRRVFLIKFPKRFKQDPSISIKISEDTNKMVEEYEGLLFKVLRHLIILRGQNLIFSRDHSLENVREEYESLSDPLAEFIKISCETTHDEKHYIFKSDFLQKLNKWLKENNSLTYTDKRASKEMKAVGYEERKKEGENNRRLAWVGIRWKKAKKNVLIAKPRKRVQGVL